MAQIREPPRTEVIDAVIGLFSRYTGTHSEQTSIITSSPKSSSASSVTSSHHSSIALPPPPIPPPVIPVPTTSANTLRLQHELESKEDYIHQLSNENNRLNHLLNTTSAKLEDTITILSTKANGWLNLEKELDNYKDQYNQLNIKYENEVMKNKQLQQALDDTLHKLHNQDTTNLKELENLRTQLQIKDTTIKSMNNLPPPEPLPNAAPPSIPLAKYRSLETEIASLRSELEQEKSLHNTYQQRYEKLLQQYHTEIPQYQQEIELLQQQVQQTSHGNQAIVEQLRNDNVRLSKLLGIDHYTDNSHFINSPNDILPKGQLDSHTWQRYQAGTFPSSSPGEEHHTQNTNGYLEEEDLNPPTAWSDAPTWVPEEALTAAHELFMMLSPNTSSQDSVTLQTFLLRTNQAYYQKLLAIMKKQEKIFKKKLAWRVPFKEVLQASTITRLRSTVSTLQTLLDGRVPPMNQTGFGATTVDRDNATPGEIAFGRHDTYRQNSTINSVQHAVSRNSLGASPNNDRGRSVSPSKARLLSVPGSGGKRLDGYESAQLLVQAMECVDFLQNKIHQLEQNAVSRSPSPVGRMHMNVSESAAVPTSMKHTTPPSISPNHHSPTSPHLPMHTFRNTHSPPSLLSPSPTDTLRTVPVDGTLRRTPQQSHTLLSSNILAASPQKSPLTPPLEVRDAIMASQSPYQFSAGMPSRRSASKPGTW